MHPFYFIRRSPLSRRIDPSFRRFEFVMGVLLCLLVSVTASASHELAPSSYTEGGKTFVFPNFLSAHYEMDVDVDAQKAWMKSEILLEVKESGYVLFDLVPSYTYAEWDGEKVGIDTVVGPDSDQLPRRAVNRFASPGVHRLTITHEASKELTWSEQGAAWGFWMSDLNDRGFLEKALPTSFEYDAYAISISLRIRSVEPHVLVANGEVKTFRRNQFEVKFPEYFNCSALFFHFFEKKRGDYQRKEWTHISVDGRRLPVLVYGFGLDLNPFVSRAQEVLKELERDYGAFPHPKVIIMARKQGGGMEHAGATSTSLRSLGHELFHSYHARSVMPANGNSGWMDEAIASWRDKGYLHEEHLPQQVKSLAGFSDWKRNTTRDSYTYGQMILRWIAQQLQVQGQSLKQFLQVYHQDRKQQKVNTEMFRSDLEIFSHLNFDEAFQKFVYAPSVSKTGEPGLNLFSEIEIAEEPMHTELTDEIRLKLNTGE